MRTPTTAAPLLKWAGGKRWFVEAAGEIVADELAPPLSTGRYFEPFLGGAALALFLGDRLKLRERMVLTDVLQPLAEFYQVVRDIPGELAWGLSAVAVPGVSKEDYYRVRESRPETPVGRAARLMYLNRLGFNGLYRENRSGGFNVPYGDAGYRASVVGRSSRDAIESLFPNREKIQRVSDALAGALIGQADFEEAVDAAGAGDLVYADPPYDGTFESYASGGFGEGDQERLAAALARAASRGATVIAHNSLTTRIEVLYQGWTILKVAEKRSIAANGEKRGRAPSVVMVSPSDYPALAGRLSAALGAELVTTGA